MFEVGDRVVYKKEFEDNSRDVGKVGVITRMRRAVVLVKFDNGGQWWVPNREEYLQQGKKMKSWHDNKLKFNFINADEI